MALQVCPPCSHMGSTTSPRQGCVGRGIASSVYEVPYCRGSRWVKPCARRKDGAACHFNLRPVFGLQASP